MSKDKKTKVTISEEALNDESKVQEVEVRETKDKEQKIQELNFQGLKNQESKHQEINLHEAKKPANLRANAMPVDGFVLSIDGKLKKRYESSEDAMAAGTKLKQNFPALQVAVYDATGRNYTPVELHCGASVANGPKPTSFRSRASSAFGAKADVALMLPNIRFRRQSGL